jgi:uncharacterized coiled-coil DUF342 family protein
MTLKDDIEELQADAEELRAEIACTCGEKTADEVFEMVDIEVRHILADIQTLFNESGDLRKEIEDPHYEIKDLREENRKLAGR